MLSNKKIQIGQAIINIVMVGVLAYTAYWVKLYWEETQAMKNEMITQNELTFQAIKSSEEMKEEMVIQNKLSLQALKSSLLPVLDIRFIKAIPRDSITYDIFVENIGNGPAFNVTVNRQVVPEENKQKRAIRPATRGKLGTFSKTEHMIGRGEKIRIFTERSDSFEYVRIKVTYRDLFGDRHKIIFEGDRDNLKLVEYPKVLVEMDSTKLPQGN